MHLGSGRLKPPSGHPSGEYVIVESKRFYRITNPERMEPFFMSLVSASDHWLFISSLGGLTAGRRNADHALFPYVTEDRIHDGSDYTGSRTVLRTARDDTWYVWEPFSRRCGALYDVSRSLFKNVEGTTLIFEEVKRPFKDGV